MCIRDRLIGLALSIIATTSYTNLPIQSKVNELADNYYVEAVYSINNNMNNKSFVKNNLIDYTNEYLEYAKTFEKEFQLILFYQDYDELFIYNKLENVQIKTFENHLPYSFEEKAPTEFAFHILYR